jgi:hypothetical protein
VDYFKGTDSVLQGHAFALAAPESLVNSIQTTALPCSKQFRNSEKMLMASLPMTTHPRGGEEYSSPIQGPMIALVRSFATEVREAYYDIAPSLCAWVQQYQDHRSGDRIV